MIGNVVAGFIGVTVAPIPLTVDYLVVFFSSLMMVLSMG